MSGGRLFWRIYRSSVLVAGAAVLVLVLVAGEGVRRFEVRRTSAELERLGRLVRFQLAEVMESDPAAVDSLCQQLAAVVGARITAILPDGVVIGDSDEDPRQMDNHADRPEVRAALQGRVGRSLRYSHTVKRDLAYVALPVFSDEQLVGVVRVAIPTRSLAEAVRPVRHRLLLVAAAVLAISAGVSLVTAKRISRPIERMREAAQRLAHGRWAGPLVPEGPTELQSLAESLNDMATQLAQRLHELSDHGRRLETILTGMAEGIIAVDADGKVILVNPSASRILGSPQGLAGKSLSEFCRDPNLNLLVREAIEQGGPVSGELTIPPGGQRVVSARAAPVRSRKGNVLGAVIVLQDITEVRRLEKMRRDFVANVAHELRTPITSILGYTETLLSGEVGDGETVSYFLRVIYRQAERLRAIVDDLLLLARLDAPESKRAIHLEATDVRRVVEEAIEVCQPTAAGKGMRVDLECPAGLEVMANAPLLVQAVVNLLDNAIKYSDPGKVVTVRAVREPGAVVIAVEDQGWGIPEEHLPRLFERFYRVDKSRSREMGGTGLGLAIVKHVAEVHGGRVTVRTKLGLGSTFSIYLPIRSATEPPQSLGQS
ncbi:MAG: ATP-binding protein [candidate division KSB1 bacterium]|nr:ATP-binding protein [candidate division KSB1 bacterium]